MRVTFDSAGDSVVGDLHLPDGDARAGAVVLLGPLTSVKEQATGNYARVLARRGWIALSFDPRHFGDSGGQPRQLESPLAKIEDARSAVTFLRTHRRVDRERIVALGVCAGAGYMAGAVARDLRLRAFGAVAGFFHDAAQQRTWMGDRYDAELARARAARLTWETTGRADLIPAVGKGDVAMPLEEAFAYYGTTRGAVGGYRNELAVMSRELTLRYDALSSAAAILAPTVLVHSDKALAPSLARSFFERLRSPRKELHWLSSQGQIDFYDDPALIELAVDRVLRTFASI